MWVESSYLALSCEASTETSVFSSVQWDNGSLASMSIICVNKIINDHLGALKMQSMA